MENKEAAESATISPDELLLEAALENDIIRARKALAAGASANAKDRVHYALHRAVFNGDLEFVNLLLDHDACILNVDAAKRTSLSIAVKLMRHDISRAILRKADENDPPVGVELMNTRDQTNRSPVMWAVLNNDLNFIREILYRYEDIDIHHQDIGLRTCLIHACLLGYYEIARLLIDFNAHVNDVDSVGRSALFWACSQGHKDLVELLLSSGADINSQDNDGMAPIHVTAIFNKAVILEILIQKGADVNIKESHGKTPLDLAFMWCQDNNGYSESMLSLLRNGALWTASPECPSLSSKLAELSWIANLLSTPSFKQWRSSFESNLVSTLLSYIPWADDD